MKFVKSIWAWITRCVLQFRDIVGTWIRDPEQKGFVTAASECTELFIQLLARSGVRWLRSRLFVPQTT